MSANWVPRGKPEVFPWTRTEECLRELLEHWNLTPDPSGRRLVAEECRAAEPGARVEFCPPLLQIVPSQALDARGFLAGLQPCLGRQLLILIQAGAAALGLWDDDDLLAHRVIKKYVVRGHGRAQPLHLKTKGKSRYGSRLRLNNARQLLVEINEKLIEWWEEFGPADRILHSCPVRLWAELFRATPSPPFTDKGRSVKIPMDVHVPNFEELLRVRRSLAHGRIIRWDPADSPADPPSTTDR